MRHADWLRFIHSRNAVGVMTLMAGGAMWVASKAGVTAPAPYTCGIINTVTQPLIASGATSLYFSIGINIVIALLLIYLNKIFNPMRAMTNLQAGLFMIMQGALPASAVWFGSGELLALVAILCIFLLYASYSDTGAMRNIFLAFLLISALSAADTAALILLPVFWLALAQMRIFSLRSVLASLLGLATPWIILLGLGIVPLDRLQFTMPKVASFFAGTPDEVPMLVTVATTAFLTVAAWLQNAMKILSYNARFRAFQSVLSVLSLVVILAVTLDYTRVMAYIPLLDCCAAMQVAHLFAAVHRREKSYIAVLSLVFIYILFYLWTIITCIS